jgi:hypothetical protein
MKGMVQKLPPSKVPDRTSSGNSVDYAMEGRRLRSNSVDYAMEGRRLLELVNLGAEGAPARYSPCDPLWRHPETSATLFVGGSQAASNREMLRERRITRIVNCQDSDGRNYFEGDPQLVYLKFPIGRWRSTRGVLDGADGTWAFWEEYFSFVFQSLRDGHNVLVHCLAGAHRAGTAGIAILMLILGLEWQPAAAAAKCLRSAIEPIGGFPEVLQALEKSRSKRQDGVLRVLGLGAACGVQCQDSA